MAVAPYVYADQYRFGQTGCLHLQCRLLKTEVAVFSEALVTVYATTRRHMPEASILHSLTLFKIS